MAAPSAPTLATICAEGIQKAVKSTSGRYAGMLTRAQNTWIEEIKNDIYNLSRELRSLVGEQIIVTVQNQSAYAMPSDYESTVDVVLLDATHYGQCSGAGTATSMILAAAEDVTEADILGREVLIYAGTGAAQIAQCIAYNTATKEATFPAGSFSTPPDATSYYMIIDDSQPLGFISQEEYDAAINDVDRDEPYAYTIKEDTGDVGVIGLFPPPWYADSNLTVWGVRHRYYSNVMLLDTSGALISKLYRRYRNVFTQGIYAKTLKDIDDERAVTEEATYYSMIKVMVAKEAPRPKTIDFVEPFC